MLYACIIVVVVVIFFRSFSSSLLIQFELTAVVQYMCVCAIVHSHSKISSAHSLAPLPSAATHNIQCILEYTFTYVYNIVVYSHSTFRVKML